MKKLRIAITGATGLLGRNLLFEILKQNLSHLDSLEILVLGRPRKSASTEDRFEDIVLHDGSYYLGFGPRLSDELIAQIKDCLKPISFDLSVDDLDISADDFKILKSEPIDYFFHVAALTDFRSGKAIEQKLNEINVEGTKRICQLISALKVKEVIYIGSAYSCGVKEGNIEPDYINLEGEFRNPYEKSKLLGEIHFRQFAINNRLKYRIFRPSTISGRLLEAPIGATSKFDVFYGWAAFFLSQKAKNVSNNDLFEKFSKMPVRIWVNPDKGLNIVPADYAAKVLYLVCCQNDVSRSFYLANDLEALHKEYISWMFDFLKIDGVKFVNQMPEGLNKLEQLYYKSVGRIFTPYIIADLQFDTSNLSDIKNKNELFCPVINNEEFLKLLGYARTCNFGIKIRGRTR